MNVWLVGGEKVIPTSVEAAIKGDGYTVSRINGSDRYETAAMVAEAGIKMSGKKPSKVFVASGASFADALAVSPVAFAKGYPIILTEKDSTSDFSKKELGNIGTDAKILVGGTSVVSDKVKADLSITTRVAGDDRAVTANLVSDWAKSSEGFSKANAALVGGTNGNGADSLVAAAPAGKAMTTLHFAGWDATNVYLKDHAAELTGKGWVFGGKAAVSEGQVSAAQSAGQTAGAVANQFNVLSASGMTFTYADSNAKVATIVTYKSTDLFTVDGNPSSIGAFQTAITAGDMISWSKDSSGVTKYALVNTTVTSGLLGTFDTTAKTFNIVDPSTGSPLTAAAISYVPASAIYQVSGQTVGLADFVAALSWGDQISITGGTGVAGSPRTFALTNQTVSGTVVAPQSNALSGGYFGVKTAAGAVFGDYNSNAGTPTVLVNGASAPLATLQSHLSAGDAVSVSTTASGAMTISLTDMAATSVTGVFSANASHVYTYFVGNTSSTVSTASGTWTYKLNGTTVTQAEFEAGATAGSALTFTTADGTINTSGVVSLTTAPLSGVVGAYSSGTATVYAGSGTNTLSTVNVTSGFYPSSTAQNYFINGNAVPLSTFQAEMGRIGAGQDTGSLSVVLNGTTTEYRVSTATAAATVSAVSASSAGSKTITITFNNPVYLSGTAAASDFVVTGTGTPGSTHSATFVSSNASTTLSGATTSIVLTLSTGSTFASGDTGTVQLSSTGAAKFKDAAGNAAVANATATTFTFGA